MIANLDTGTLADAWNAVTSIADRAKKGEALAAIGKRLAQRGGLASITERDRVTALYVAETARRRREYQMRAILVAGAHGYIDRPYYEPERRKIPVFTDAYASDSMRVIGDLIAREIKAIGLEYPEIDGLMTVCSYYPTDAELANFAQSFAG